MSNKSRQCHICLKVETAKEIRDCEDAQQWAESLISDMEAEIYDPSGDIVDAWETELDSYQDHGHDVG
jgi:hypothetical protein